MNVEPLTHSLPPVDQLAARIELCRQEMAELKKLYHAALAVKKAQEARDGREALARRKGVPNVGR
jgi:hypothetical protein